MPRALSGQTRRISSSKKIPDIDTVISRKEPPSSELHKSVHPWFGRPAGEGERNRIIEAAIPLITARMPARGDRHGRVDSLRFLNRLFDWLESFTGDSYQDCWEASGADLNPKHWCPELAASAGRRQGIRLAVNALILLGVIRPSLEWIFANKQARFYRDWTELHDAEHWSRYFDFATREQAPERKLWGTATDLIRICLVNGLSIAQVRREHVLAYRSFLIDTGRSAGDLLAMWHYTRGAGLLAGEPDELRAIILAQPRTPTELIDRYDIKAPTVRKVLIAYITELSVSQDYGSLDASSRVLAFNFWKQIEEANPGIDTINLTAEQANQWKTWLKTAPKKDGNLRRDAFGIMGTVRSFYLDIAAWAHQDPAAWANWAVACPISIADVKGVTKQRKHRTAGMQARTRTLAPHLEALVIAAERRYQFAVELRDAARASKVNEPFTVQGDIYCRTATARQSKTTNNYVLKQGESTRLDTEGFVTKTFMTWTFIEVLRHTGVRVEEMIELTHLSIRQYRKPDGTVLPLLQIAPSKNDEERILPCSPELTSALARLIKFVSIDGRIPLCCRRDDHERTMSAPMPFLFQLREAGRSRVASYGTVRNWLAELAETIELKDTDGTPLHFTPHDFRRMFITDIVNAGFPIHLAAKLVGHNSIEVTRSYTAVYQKDVFEAYERFIQHRRASRPSAEYREPTEEEWDEFVEHFGRRKVALGDCHRPYGSDCVHEHACIRCDFLQVDPGQGNRLQEVRQNLQAQVDEAERNRWLGDVDQLRVTIQHADQKAEMLRRQLGEGPEIDLVHPIADLPMSLPH